MQKRTEKGTKKVLLYTWSCWMLTLRFQVAAPAYGNLLFWWTLGALGRPSSPFQDHVTWAFEVASVWFSSSSSVPFPVSRAPLMPSATVEWDLHLLWESSMQDNLRWLNSGSLLGWWGQHILANSSGTEQSWRSSNFSFMSTILSNNVACFWDFSGRNPDVTCDGWGYVSVYQSYSTHLIKKKKRI